MGLKSGDAQRGGEFLGIFTPKNLLIYKHFRGRAEKVVVHVHYWHHLEWRPCIFDYLFVVFNRLVYLALGSDFDKKSLYIFDIIGNSTQESNNIVVVSTLLEIFDPRL